MLSAASVAKPAGAAKQALGHPSAAYIEGVRECGLLPAAAEDKLRASPADIRHQQVLALVGRARAEKGELRLALPGDNREVHADFLQHRDEHVGIARIATGARRYRRHVHRVARRRKALDVFPVGCDHVARALHRLGREDPRGIHAFAQVDYLAAAMHLFEASVPHIRHEQSTRAGAYVYGGEALDDWILGGHGASFLRCSVLRLLGAATRCSRRRGRACRSTR